MDTPKKWSEATIRELILTNDGVLYGALMQLYNRQTSSEQRTGTTRDRNGVGFNGCDANFLSSLSVYYMRHGYLTDNQKRVARRKLPKYSKQLTKIANGEL